MTRIPFNNIMTGTKTCRKHQIYRYHCSSEEMWTMQASSWIPREGEQSNNQPNRFDNESLLVSSMNSFRFRLGMLDNDRHVEKWLPQSLFIRLTKQGECHIFLIKSVELIDGFLKFMPLANLSKTRAWKMRGDWRKLYCQKPNNFKIDGPYRTHLQILMWRWEIYKI